MKILLCLSAALFFMLTPKQGISASLASKARVATINAPEKLVEVFKRSKSENLSNWLYTVVIIDDGDSEVHCGDEKTVTAILDTLKTTLSPNKKGKFAYTKTTGRCPAAEKWHFKTPSMNAHYCSENEKTQAIDNAIDWFKTLPTCSESEE